MARAGVGNDIAERVLGHRIAGVQGIYNRHSYEDEKADALRRGSRCWSTKLSTRPTMS